MFKSNYKGSKMNFICAISKTLIKKSQNVRVFFIESKMDNLYPFMNSMSASVSDNFSPLGVAFKAKLVDNEYDESFSFNLDSKDSSLKDVFLNYINEKTISKEDAEKQGLLNHWSKDIEWNEMKSLDEVFNRVVKSALYFEKNHADKNNFVTAMIVHEKVYNLMLKHGNIKEVISSFKKGLKSSDFLEYQSKINSSFQRILKDLESHLGNYHMAIEKETVIVDEEIIKVKLEEFSHLKGSKNLENQQIYKALEKECRAMLGETHKLSLKKERFVDEEYVQKHYIDFKIDFSGSKENELAKESSNCINSVNFLNETQMKRVCAVDFKKENWSQILESYLIELMMEIGGLEYLPSRRQFLNNEIINKDFIKEMSDLALYK